MVPPSFLPHSGPLCDEVHLSVHHVQQSADPHRPRTVEIGPNRPNLSPLSYATFSLLSHGGYQECPSALRSLLRLDPSVRIQHEAYDVPQGTRRSRGGSYPYSASAHSWPPPSSRAVCSAIIIPELQGCPVLASPPLFSTHKSATPNPLYRHVAFPTVV